jgi:diacylglycerol kinase family enzyme
MPVANCCVIFNPRAGRDRAGGRLQRLRALLGARAVFRPTERPGHGEELALEAAQAGHAVVAAAGGDGTVHEVANGVLRAGRSEVLLEIYPIGSANDYAHSLGLTRDWKFSADSQVAPRAVDVGLVRLGDGRQRYFVNGLGLGFNGHVTLEAQRIGWLQGRLLYNLALLRALVLRFEAVPMTVTLDEVVRQVPTLALSVALGRREGNFVLAPDAIVDDGLFDYLHAGAVSRWALVRNLLRINTGRLPRHPLLWRGRCRSVRVEALAGLPVHLDGEVFERAAREMEISLLPGALRVMARGGAVGVSAKEPVRSRCEQE